MDALTLTAGTEAALLSALGYREFEATLLMRHPDAIIITNRNARAVIIDRPETTTVIYAGSDDCDDWIGNAHRGKVHRPGIGKVYDGVADYYNLLREAVHEAIPDMEKPWHLIGHSLGGACAEMCAARRVIKQRPVASLHTFGAPMVGDADFARVSATIFNAHNWWIKGDVVPYQPRIAGMFSIGYKRARDPHVIDGLKVTSEAPFWTPQLMRWVRRGVAHSAYAGYYEDMMKLRQVVTP